MNEAKIKKLVMIHTENLMNTRFRKAACAGKDCLFWAWAAALALRKYGLRSVLQAGTCFWPRLTEEQAKERPTEADCF